MRLVGLSVSVDDFFLYEKMVTLKRCVDPEILASCNLGSLLQSHAAIPLTGE
jgi:hypothetical protein